MKSLHFLYLYINLINRDLNPVFEMPNSDAKQLFIGYKNKRIKTFIVHIYIYIYILIII